MNRSSRLRRVFAGAFVLTAGLMGLASADTRTDPVATPSPASTEIAPPLHEEIARRASALTAKVIAWRRDIHAHPELGNREQRTAAKVIAHLRALKLDVRTGVAGTGVIGVLTGGMSGPAVALRADMDALPVEEPTTLPFASKAKGVYLGKQVAVMHACGHDAHTAMLMAVAEILAGLRANLPGTVVFLFQPAEEGPSDFEPDGRRFWGARQMVAEGALARPRPEAVFGLHVWAGVPSGTLSYRTGPTMASSDELRIRVTGRQTHCALPWKGVDPITIAAQAILGLQTVVSRQADLTASPAVISIGTIEGGTRLNIIPGEVGMTGTVRAFDPAVRQTLHEGIRRSTSHIAESGGASAEVSILEKYHSTVNDGALLARMEPTLRWAADGHIAEAPLVMASEDFSFYAREVPGLFVFLGITPADQDMARAAPNHNPGFYVDEAALTIGVRALAGLAADYLYVRREVPATKP
ncbi:MAG: amidohydrolase [Methylotetracoccus sp.]